VGSIDSPRGGDDNDHMKRLNLYKLIVLTLIGLVGGCSSSNSDNVTYVVVTGNPPAVDVNTSITQPPATIPQVVQQNTPVPTVATAAPVPTTSADMTPEIALRIGDSYFLNGYFENAVTTYQSILARDDTSMEIGASAAFNMGRAALRAGLFREAVEAMNVLLSSYPSDFRAAQGYFLRGDAYLGLSQWQNALNDFEQYLQLRGGLIDSYVYERMGDAHVNLGQLDAAFDSYSRATNATRPLVSQLAFKEKLANLYILNGQVDRAVNEYDAILEVAQNEAYRAQISFDAAQALLNAGETDAGLARLRVIFRDYPAQSQAYIAMERLLENGVTLDSYQQGLVSYYAADYARAIDLFNTYTTQVTLDAIPAQLYLFLGRSYRALDNGDAAVVAFQTIIEQYPQDPLFGDALLETGRTRFLAGEIDAAITRYTEIANNYAYLPETAAEALWRVGYLHGTNERPAESRDVFLRLADTFPDSEQAVSGLFFAASAALNAGDDVTAETLYARLAVTATGEDQASAYLQVGRLAAGRGEAQSAQQAYQLAAQAAPDTYYAARASDLVVGREPFSQPSQYVFSFDDLADVTEAENWLRTTFGVVQDGPLWPLSPTLRNDPRIVRGRELWFVGAYDAAVDEFFAVIRDYSGDGLASYQLAIEMRILGAYYPSIFAAANVIITAGVPTLEAPGYIARMRYPAYYRDVVLEASEERGVDPLLVFSLIRHESLFNTFATAAAGEKGMTQVIPTTGDYIAQQLDWPDYQHSDLFRPYAGVAFGVYFLDENLERFDGNTYAALAGYNAGPGRAIDWLELSGGDPDRFMDAITISSTQLYIQLIYRNYNIYRALYGV